MDAEESAKWTSDPSKAPFLCNPLCRILLGPNRGGVGDLLTFLSSVPVEQKCSLPLPRPHVMLLPRKSLKAKVMQGPTVSARNPA